MEVDLSLLEELTRCKEENEAERRRTMSDGEPPDGPGLESRVRALEVNVASIDKTLAIMSEQLKHLATKDDLRAVQVEAATRFGKLDADVAAINVKLDTKASATDLATLAGKLDRKADATDLAELKGRVARIPTVPVLTSILVFVSLLFAAGTWPLRHLPPAWANAFQ